MLIVGLGLIWLVVDLAVGCAACSWLCLLVCCGWLW